MPNIVPPSPQQPIVDGQDRQTQTFRTWTSDITRLDMLVGEGSPEGVVDAEQGRLYLDSTGSTGSVLYVKRDPGISGDATQGWIAV